MKFIFTLTTLMISMSTFAAGKLALSVELNPAGSFTATTEKIKGQLLKNKDGSFAAKELSVVIKSMKTGIDLRDDHLWKHLNFQKHPKVTLSDIKGKDGTGAGTLEISGIKRPVEITYTEEGSNIRASFSVRASEFKLPDAQYMGVGVEDMVKGEVTLPFTSI